MFFYNIDFLTFSYQGGCCAAYKIEQTNEGTGELIWISRFGAGSDSDEEGFHFTCGKVVGYKHIKNFMITWKNEKVS